jgi:dUTPase
MIMTENEKAEIIKGENLVDADRDNGGFGHVGKKLR